MNMPIAILNRRRRGVAVPEWDIEGSTILESPPPPSQPIVIEDRIEA